jgi:hypothetical protein
MAGVVGDTLVGRLAGVAGVTLVGRLAGVVGDVGLVVIGEGLAERR